MSLACFCMSAGQSLFVCEKSENVKKLDKNEQMTMFGYRLILESDCRRAITFCKRLQKSDKKFRSYVN